MHRSLTNMTADQPPRDLNAAVGNGSDFPRPAPLSERLWFPTEREEEQAPIPLASGAAVSPVFADSPTQASARRSSAREASSPVDDAQGALDRAYDRVLEAAALLGAPRLSEDVPSAEQSEGRRALLRLCEPLFRLICRLNRMKRLGHWNERYEPGQIRAEVESVFKQMSASAGAATVPGLSATLAELIGPLRCFVDVVMTRAGFEFSAEWYRLEPQRDDPDRVLLGTTAEALRDGGVEAVDRLAVLHACLGFTADLLHPVANLPSAESLLDIATRRLHGPLAERICSSAYEGVFTQAILPPIGRRIRAMVVIGGSVLLLAIAGAVVLNVGYARALDRSIESVRGALERAAHTPGKVAPAGD